LIWGTAINHERTFVVIKESGILKQGMIFSYINYENGHIYLWAHEPILGMNQFKFSEQVIKENFKII